MQVQGDSFLLDLGTSTQWVHPLQAARPPIGAHVVAIGAPTLTGILQADQLVVSPPA